MNTAIPTGFVRSEYRTPSLGSAEVHIWLVGLDTQQFSPDGLSADEWARANRFHFRHDAIRYSHLHRTLRALLGDYLGVAGTALSFSIGEHGKPSLATPHRELHFNLSRSADRGLIAVSRGSELGIDIERHKQTSDLLKIARSFFATDELHALEVLDAESRRIAFYDTWARKEAYLKALGTGLSKDLTSFSTVTNPITGFTRVGDHLQAIPVDGWTLSDIPLGPTFSGALVTQSVPGLQQRLFTRNL